MVVLLQLNNIPARITHIGEVHSVSEAFYEGDWHMFDPSIGIYFIDDKNNIASTEQVINNKTLIDQALLGFKGSQKLREFTMQVFIGNQISSIENGEEVLKKIQGNSNTVQLGPNEVIRFYRDWQDQNIFKETGTEIDFSNGLLFSNFNTWNTVEGDYVKKSIVLPFIITQVFIISGSKRCQEDRDLWISVDNVNWKRVNRCENQVWVEKDMFQDNFRRRVYFEYYIKTRKKIGKSTSLVTQFQFGKNLLTTKENIYSLMSGLSRKDIKYEVGY